MVGQDWSASAYDRSARFVNELGGELLTWLDPKPGERILDLCCGDGHLTKEIAARGAIVTGIDASPSMIEAARKLGLNAQLADAHNLASSRSSKRSFPMPHCTGWIAPMR